METTFKGNPKTLAIPVVMVTICTEYTSSRNMEASFKGIPKTIAYAVEMVTISIKHTWSGNIEATFKEHPKHIASPVVMGTIYTEPKIWKPFFKDSLKLKLIPVLMVTICTEHTRSKNMKPLLKKILKL